MAGVFTPQCGEPSHDSTANSKTPQGTQFAETLQKWYIAALQGPFLFVFFPKSRRKFSRLKKKDEGTWICISTATMR
jgi:hypothetical protein